MAGCFGSSAEDRYFESQLDDWLDSQEPITDKYGDKARDIIEARYNEVGGLFDEWLEENEYLPTAGLLTDENYNTIVALVRTDKKARDAYYDAVFEDVCCDLAEADNEEPDSELDYDDYRHYDDD